jgi:hypothetical protein
MHAQNNMPIGLRLDIDDEMIDAWLRLHAHSSAYNAYINVVVTSPSSAATGGVYPSTTNSYSMIHHQQQQHYIPNNHHYYQQQPVQTFGHHIDSNIPPMPPPTPSLPHVNRESSATTEHIHLNITSSHLHHHNQQQQETKYRKAPRSNLTIGTAQKHPRIPQQMSSTPTLSSPTLAAQQQELRFVNYQPLEISGERRDRSQRELIPVSESKTRSSNEQVFKLL